MTEATETPNVFTSLVPGGMRDEANDYAEGLEAEIVKILPAVEAAVRIYREAEMLAHDAYDSAKSAGITKGEALEGLHAAVMELTGGQRLFDALTAISEATDVTQLA